LKGEILHFERRKSIIILYFIRVYQNLNSLQHFKTTTTRENVVVLKIIGGKK